jgi:ribosomal-protein-alanine N-acetyltransferase
MIETPRFTLRPLTPGDATARYSAWLDDASIADHVAGAGAAHSIADLSAYIAARAGRDDVLFLGIFTREGGEHIGNIKYEPVNRAQAYAVMGILIGERQWRGRGVAEEAIRATAEWLYAQRGIREIVLGVKRDHGAAIAAYRKIGFEVRPDDRIVVPAVTATMVWRLQGSPRGA